MQIVSQLYHVEGVAISMPGGRPENQDDIGYAETPLGFLVVVCDGMGGGPGGKTASGIVKQVVISDVAASSPQATPIDVLKKAVDHANEALEEEMRRRPELRGMGSTLVALLINERQATVAHLGDSRCYKVSGRHIDFRTKDHSLVGELVETGALTEEQARTSPQSNVITRGLGSTTNHVAEFDEVLYRRGDRFIICTDGVWGIMSHDDLKLRLCSGADIPSLVRSLSQEIDMIGASQGGHHDNHTMAVLEMKQDSILYNKMTKKFKILLTVLCVLLAVSVCYNVFSLFREKEGVNIEVEVMQAMQDELEASNQNLERENKTQAERIEQLQTTLHEMEQSSAYGESQLQSKYKTVLNDCDSLRKIINDRDQEISTLKQQVETASKAAAVTDKASSAPVNDNAVQALTVAINSIDQLARVHSKKQNEVSKKVQTNVNAAKKALADLDKQTNNAYHQFLEVYQKELNSGDFNPKTNVVHDRKGYRMKDATRKKALTMVDGLQRLKQKITK